MHMDFSSAWQGFAKGNWVDEINVRDFIQKNVTPYHGDDLFLENATERTKSLWQTVLDLTKLENEKGILDAEVKKPSSIISHGP